MFIFTKNDHCEPFTLCGTLRSEFERQNDVFDFNDLIELTT